MPSNETPSPAEIEAIGYLTGAVTGYERAGGSAPVIVVPVGYVRTLLALLAAQEAARRDSEQVTRFEVIDHRSEAEFPGRCFVAYDSRVELSYQDVVNDLIDAARQSTPTGATNATPR